MTEYNVKFVNHATQKEIKGEKLKKLQEALNTKPKKEVKDKFDFFGVKKKLGGFTKRGPCKK